MLNGEVSHEIVGESTKAFQSLSADTNSPNPIAELTTIIPVDIVANAIEVEWKLNVKGEEMSYKLILPLEDTPSENVLGIIPANSSVSINKLNCPTY